MPTTRHPTGVLAPFRHLRQKRGLSNLSPQKAGSIPASPEQSSRSRPASSAAGRPIWDSCANGSASGPHSPTWCRFESGLSRLHTHPSGAGFPISSRRLRGSRPCGCTSPKTGNGLLSSFLSPAEAGHMVGVAQRKSGGLQNRASPVRIRPRPPGANMPHRCQKWESPNLSSADSRQRPPAGVEPYPAVIWDSSSEGRVAA